MRSGAISGACNPSAAMRATMPTGSGVKHALRREPLNRRSSTSAIRMSRLDCVTSGRNSTMSRPSTASAEITPAGAPGPPSACASGRKASGGAGSIARAMIASSYQRPSRTRPHNSAASTPCGPSTRTYVRGMDDGAPKCKRTPSACNAEDRRSSNGDVNGASIRSVRAQSTMRRSLAA
jgi:hypothetical protein